jgi:hypothetical protein
MERRSTSSRNWFRRAVSVATVLFVSGTGALVMAQEPVDYAADQSAPQAQMLAPQQLDNLVAPIALYPDPLLGQVLVAATYPVEVVEAQQWLQANRGLQGQQLTDAARQQNWDASVQTLVAMPDVLSKLNQDIRWTTDLGNAFLAQQADVMAAVQRLRARAQSNGKLQSTPQQTVTTANDSGQTAIEIEPANPEVIYVPTYDPAYVWGQPVYGYYPALYYPSYGYYWGSGIDVGLYFGGWGGWGYGGWGWGWGPNWFGHTVFVNNYFFNRYGYRYGSGFSGGYRGRTGWTHDPVHRLGVNYSTARLNSRFGEASRTSRIEAGRSGNWHNFGQPGGNRGTGTPQAGSRNGFQGDRNGSQGGYQRFQQGRQGYQAPEQRNNNNAPAVQQQQQRSNSPAMQQRYNSPGQTQRSNNSVQQERSNSPVQQRYNAPAQSQPRYNAPVQSQPRYNAPAQSQPRYSAPAQSQPRYSAPAQQRFSAPSAPRNSAPAPSFQRSAPAPSSSAPRSFGGGGSGGSGGGGFHGGGGGGGSARSSGGGGGHGRR